MNNNASEAIRVRNPFLDPLVTELIENPNLYLRMFSEQILVGETLQVFQPMNVVLLGPQGSGKSMILNLIRYRVLSEWLIRNGTLPSPLASLLPFLGISVNLVRANFHAFGRRSIAKAMGTIGPDPALELASAGDYLNHFLLREFIKALQFIISGDGRKLGEWLGFHAGDLSDEGMAVTIAAWDSWFGYYKSCNSLDALLSACEDRLSTWRSFLNANVDSIPFNIWTTKSGIGEPLHSMGNFLSSIAKKPLPLFVVIDQYEVLPELNLTHGTSLQRLVNTLIKARDPVVFYKVGARTYDWGAELRIWGAESRIEVLRDYVPVNLSDVLMRHENRKGWVFPDFATDVARKRILVGGNNTVERHKVHAIFGSWSPQEESRRYFRDREPTLVVLRGVTEEIRQQILSLCGEKASPLELRLAAAWALQQLQRGFRSDTVLMQMEDRPWTRPSWAKERIGVGLLQVASLANQKRIYNGWDTVVSLAGFNITAFLLICGEIWDTCTKFGFNPLRELPLPEYIQSEGIYAASLKWRERDRIEWTGGRKRYEVLGRLGPAISARLKNDLAISNPGHSGFSLRESDFWAPPSEHSKEAKVAQFLFTAVSWAILEERPHTSKKPEAVSRRKWYLHPLLSPAFQIPFRRVKEPFYTDVDTVYGWIFGSGSPRFGTARARYVRTKKYDVQLPFQLGGP